MSEKVEDKIKRMAEAYNTYWDLKAEVEAEGYLVNGSHAEKFDKEDD